MHAEIVDILLYLYQMYQCGDHPRSALAIVNLRNLKRDLGLSTGRDSVDYRR